MAQMNVHTFPVSLLGYADFSQDAPIIDRLHDFRAPHQRLSMSADVIVTRIWGHAYRGSRTLLLGKEMYI